MAHYWLIISLWFGTASLQYINTAGPGSDSILDPNESLQYQPLPYVNYFNLASARNDFESIQKDANAGQTEYYEQDHDQSDLPRKRRTIEEERLEERKDTHWEPALVDLDKTVYLRNDDKLGNPFIVHNSNGEENNTERSLLESLEKRSFSPWGGKRSDSMENMWTWKRAANVREPSMPKRVRFSPWGGKRSGQMIYKPGNKGSKVIFSASVPELTRIVSNYSPNERLDFAGFQFVPSIDKRHPIKFLALSTKVNDRTLRDELPFKTFIDSLPRIFKPGHTYSDVNLKKDGKRKVKFSAWGGKRSPPIIGPIWTPAPQNIKESTLDSIVLIRNSQDNENPKAM